MWCVELGVEGGGGRGLSGSRLESICPPQSSGMKVLLGGRNAAPFTDRSLIKWYLSRNPLTCAWLDPGKGRLGSSLCQTCHRA